MMDEMQMIRSLLDRPAPEQSVVGSGRDRLRAAARAGSRPRPGRRAMWLSGGLGLTAVTAAAAVALAAPGSVGGRPDSGRPSRAPTTALSARGVLLAAASVAAGRDDGVGRYWHSVTVNRYYARADGGYTVVEESRDEGWTPRAPHHDQWGRSRRLGVRPAGPADAAAWRRAGSPATVMVTIAGKRAKLSTRPGRTVTSRAPLTEGDKVFWLGRNVTMKDLRALPADPKRLRASLLRWYGGHDTESDGRAMSSDLWLYTVARGLVLEMPVTPKVRGAAFRMLAELPAVKAVGTVKDAQGRTGTAIALTERRKTGDVLQHRLIIDTGSGRALGEDIVVVSPGGATAGLPAGSVYSSETVLGQGWTDTVPRSGTTGPARPGR